MKTHGGGVLKLLSSGQERSALIDFSASINPLGLPESVAAALQESLPLLCDYPEIDASSLRAALAAHHSLPASMVLPGNGSTSLIYLLPRVLQPRHATLVAPCFSEYRPALEQAGCQVGEYLLGAEADFAFCAEDFLARLDSHNELVWLANPGNPTAAGIPVTELEKLAIALAPKLLVVDEAFVDFSPELSLAAQLKRHPNLILLRSLTKFYAIPGLRVGYLLAAPVLVARLAASAEPWALSTPAIHAARACIADSSYRQETLSRIPRLRADFAAGLESLGCRVYPSVTNYLLAWLPSTWPASGEIAARLQACGVLVRCCDDFSGLDERYLRLAVRTESENRRLLDLLQER